PIAVLEDTFYVDSDLPLVERLYYTVIAEDIHDNRSGKSNEFSFVITGVSDERVGIPEAFELSQNYPNPFNPSTVIKYALPKSSNVSLVIYNLMGQEVMRWDENNVTPGYYEKTWNGTTQSGIPVSSGMYIYRIVAGDFVSTNKMVLLK
ncbi:T9SS type A sorting domain-containing protein, partial [candidate division KSB1 bacterium]|nr:T9SS type A sorting domain-containing protein [candidate division KSB1 bacterium]